MVWDAERSAGDIASYFDVSRPAISQHLTVLRTAGLVTDRRDGARRLYRANRDALIELQASLEAFWGGILGEQERRGNPALIRQAAENLKGARDDITNLAGGQSDRSGTWPSHTASY